MRSASSYLSRRRVDSPARQRDRTRPASNRALAKATGAALGRPAWLKVPGFALKAVFGEGAKPILGGQYVLPSVIQKHGYTFRFTEVADAVRDALTS